MIGTAFSTPVELVLIARTFGFSARLARSTLSFVLFFRIPRVGHAAVGRWEHVLALIVMARAVRACVLSRHLRHVVWYHVLCRSDFGSDSRFRSEVIIVTLRDAGFGPHGIEMAPRGFGVHPFGRLAAFLCRLPSAASVDVCVGLVGVVLATVEA